MKTISVLYLAMILPSGFASTGFDFLTGMLTDFLSTEPVTEKIIVDGAVGSGRFFTLDSVNVMSLKMDAANSSSCCQECWNTYPETQLVNFEDNFCECLKTKVGKQPTTQKVGRVSGMCGSWNYQGQGDLGDQHYFEEGSVDWQGSVNKVDDSEACCTECNKKLPGTALVEFVKERHLCHCYNTKLGKNPLLLETDQSSTICVAAKTQKNSENKTSSAAETGSVSEPLVSVDNKHVAEALTITTPKPELCDGGFSCCPDPTDGDNTLGTEQFIQESQYKSDFKSCSDACRKLYPFSNGMTQSKTQTYKSNKKPFCWCEFGQYKLQKLYPFSNGVTQSKTQTYKSNKKPFCWCEFGQYKLQASAGYQTCLFKDEAIQEDDYEY